MMHTNDKKQYAKLTLPSRVAIANMNSCIADTMSRAVRDSRASRGRALVAAPVGVARALVVATGTWDLKQ